MLRWAFAALLSGLIALAVCFPMRWAAGWFLPENIETLAPDLQLRGTVLNGTISGLPLFGTANLDISPLARSVRFQAGQARNYASGRVSTTTAKDIDFRLDFASVPFTDGRLQGLRGEFTARIPEAKYDGQICQSATGIARTDVLQRNGGAIQWTGPELTGPIRCEEGALVADLSGTDPQQTITALIRIIPDGTYQANIVVRTARAEADAVLPLFGFSRSGQSFVLTEQGNWR